MRLTVVEDIDSQKVWMSPEINHGDFPFRFMLRLQYTEEWGGEAEKTLGKYCVALLVVSPTEAKKGDSYNHALGSFGWTEEQVKEYGPAAEYLMLMEYGTAAHLWESCGNNLKVLMKQARQKLKESDMLFGFAMDRAENAIGTTGWDAVKGDILAPLHRQSDEPNVGLMKKLHGLE